MNNPYEVLAPVWKRPGKLDIVRGDGAYLYGADGREYLDMTAGVAVTGTGHCHPRVVQAIQRQAATLIHGQITMMITPPLLELVEELRRILPEQLHGFFFGNSGTEAIEAAIKLARQTSGRHGIVAFSGGFHGRTYGAMSLTTSNATYRTGYAPLLASIYLAPYPYPYRWALRTGAPPERCLDACLGDLEEIFYTQIPPKEVAAILVEPVLGEGGYVVPPRGFLQRLAEIARQHGILLIFDEVQTGFGRTGRMFAFEHSGVVPDILVMAKALGSGLPISGIAANWQTMSKWQPGTHGGTYAANPLSCAAATETLRVIHDERLVENAAAMGALLVGGLQEIARRDEGVGEARGTGLMAALELSKTDGSYDAARAEQFLSFTKEQGVLLLSCGPHKNIIRYMPPLIVSRAQIEQALHVTASALEASQAK